MKKAVRSAKECSQTESCHEDQGTVDLTSQTNEQVTGQRSDYAADRLLLDEHSYSEQQE